MSTNKLPTTQPIVLKPRLHQIIKEITNPDLSKKQSKTISDFVEVYKQTIPPPMDKAAQANINLDTLNPYIMIQFSNKNHSHMNAEYDKLVITIPLDTPAKSTLRFVGRKRGYYILDLVEDIEDKNVTFNASNVKAWKNIVHNLRPHLAHKINVLPYKHDQYDKLPI